MGSELFNHPNDGVNRYKLLRVASAIWGIAGLFVVYLLLPEVFDDARNPYIGIWSEDFAEAFILMMFPLSAVVAGVLGIVEAGPYRGFLGLVAWLTLLYSVLTFLGYEEMARAHGDWWVRLAGFSLALAIDILPVCTLILLHLTQPREPAS